MTRVMNQAALAAVAICMTATAALAQQTSSATETKTFEVIAVDGNTLVVKLPEGTRELNVPDDFRFNVNGQQMSVRELKPGLKGTATITTKTTVTPVTVTEVKDGQVVMRSGSTLVVRTGGEVKSFSQGDVDKRGVKIMREGKPAQLSDFREGDRLSATIITSAPPHVMTQKEVQAITSAPAANAAPRSAAAAPRSRSASQPALQASTTARPTLPKTASSWPLLALVSLLFLASGLVLTVRRRLVG